MNSNERVAQIKDQGFTIIESVLTPDEITRIRDALAPYLQGELMGRNDFEGLNTGTQRRSSRSFSWVAGLRANRHKKKVR